MGARSYVTRGKGNTQAFWSAPHGAGRVLSRRAAKKRYTAEDLDQRMSGIVYRPGPAWVDEIPDAYKPIDQVMADARDLVDGLIGVRSEEHTSELQSRFDIVCRLLLEKKNKK